MNSLSRKIGELENNVVTDNVTEETCFIDVSQAPDAEKQLHSQAQKLYDSVSFEDVTPQQLAVIEKSSELLTLRGFLLFRKMIRALYSIDDAYSGLFDMRLMWFLSETAKLGQQSREMVKLEKENANLDEDSLEEKRMALEDTFEDTFTEKSFDVYERDQWLKMFEHIKAKINPSNPSGVTNEQLTQYLMNQGDR